MHRYILLDTRDGARFDLYAEGTVEARVYAREYMADIYPRTAADVRLLEPETSLEVCRLTQERP
jgi:hypothetical protein